MNRPQTSTRGVRPPSAVSNISNQGLAVPSQASVAQNQRAMRPGTASRALMTANGNRQANITNRIVGATNEGRPGTSSRGMTAMRPTTQQGLGGIQNVNHQNTGRMIQDKLYWVGELRQKITSLTTEMNQMNQKIENFERDGEIMGAFERKVDVLNVTVKELQGKLGDYNMLIVHLHSDIDLLSIDQQTESLRQQNTKQQQIVDDLFAQRQKKEELAKEMQMKIDANTSRSEALLNDLDENSKSQYHELKRQNIEFESAIKEKQTKLEDMSKSINDYSQQIQNNSLKAQILSLKTQLADIESKNEELGQSSSSSTALGANSPDMIMAKLKEDGAEIATMEKKMTEMEENNRRLVEQIEAFTQTLREQEGERNAKYEELLKRDQDMQVFLDVFDTKKQEMLNSKASLENYIAYLNKLMATSDAKKNTKEDKTIALLQKEKAAKMEELAKIETLDTKIQLELEEIKSKMTMIKQNYDNLGNVDEIRQDAQKSYERNTNEKTSLMSNAANIKEMIKIHESKVESRRSQLAQNDTYKQLQGLKNQIQILEGVNHNLKESINAKEAESNYKPLAKDFINQLEAANLQVQKITLLPANLS